MMILSFSRIFSLSLFLLLFSRSPRRWRLSLTKVRRENNKWGRDEERKKKNTLGGGHHNHSISFSTHTTHKSSFPSQYMPKHTPFIKLTRSLSTCISHEGDSLTTQKHFWDSLLLFIMRKCRFSMFSFFLSPHPHLMQFLCIFFMLFLSSNRMILITFFSLLLLILYSLLSSPSPSSLLFLIMMMHRDKKEARAHTHFCSFERLFFLFSHPLPFLIGRNNTNRAGQYLLRERM